MLTIIPTTDGRASILEPELPEISLEEVLARQSKQFAVAGLSVSIYNLPARGYAVHREDRYFFIYRPQGRNGSNLSSLPRSGQIRHQLNDNGCLMVAPNARIRVEWTSAAGSLAKFGFCPGAPYPAFPTHFWHDAGRICASAPGFSLPIDCWRRRWQKRPKLCPKSKKRRCRLIDRCSIGLCSDMSRYRGWTQFSESSLRARKLT